MTRTDTLNAKSIKKGQMKVQEMAFVLVAIILFFAIAGIFYIKVGFSGFRSDVEMQRAEEVMEIVRKMAATPEFAFTKNGQIACDSCIDSDKLLALKNRSSYTGFWNVEYFRIVYVYPKKDNLECVYGVYPDCNRFTLVSKEIHENPKTAYVSLCRNEYENGVLYAKCEIGKIEISAKGIEALGGINGTG